MTTTEPMPASPAAPVIAHPGHVTVIHNSRITCWVTMATGPCLAFIGLCMVLEAGTLLFPLSSISFLGLLAAAQWFVGGIGSCAACPSLWKWGRAMLYKRIILNDSCADFRLGVPKDPVAVSLDWSDIDSVAQSGTGAATQYTVHGRDGASATFTSNTFFRATRAAKLIAQRAGLTIQRS